MSLHQSALPHSQQQRLQRPLLCQLVFNPGHSTSLPCRIHSSSDCKDPSDVNWSSILENCQRAVHHSTPFCLHTDNWRQLVSDIICFHLCAVRPLCIHQCSAGPHGKQHLLAAPVHPADTRLFSTQTDGNNNSCHCCRFISGALCSQCQKSAKRCPRTLNRCSTVCSSHLYI